MQTIAMNSGVDFDQQDKQTVAALCWRLLSTVSGTSQQWYLQAALHISSSSPLSK
jgi:hypothetical protein